MQKFRLAYLGIIDMSTALGVLKPWCGRESYLGVMGGVEKATRMRRTLSRGGHDGSSTAVNGFSLLGVRSKLVRSIGQVHKREVL